MKLTQPNLSAGQSQEVAQGLATAAQALVTAGQALSRAAALLLGQRIPDPLPQNLAVRTAWPPPAVPVLSLPASTHSVLDLVNEFLMQKAHLERGDRYLRQLRVTLKSFANGRANKPIWAITPQDVDKWIKDHNWAPRTIRGYVGDVSTMFNWAMKRDYVSRNPALGVEFPPMPTREVFEVHTPEQVSTVLETCRRFDMDVCRFLAVCYFAGIRSAEAHRLGEENVKLEEGIIEVPAAKAKTRARRIVTIQPNLKAWLQLGGEFRPIGDHLIRDARQLSKVPWPHNVARHSFISYHIAQFKKVHETALEAGTSEQLVFSNYRSVVSPTAAAEYWAIVPK